MKQTCFIHGRFMFLYLSFTNPKLEKKDRVDPKKVLPTVRRHSQKGKSLVSHAEGIPKRKKASSAMRKVFPKRKKASSAMRKAFPKGKKPRQRRRK